MYRVFVRLQSDYPVCGFHSKPTEPSACTPHSGTASCFKGYPQLMVKVMAGTEGFDPSTFRLTGDCSTWLSYAPINPVICLAGKDLACVYRLHAATPAPEVWQGGAEFPIRTEGPDFSGRRLSKPLLLASQPTQHKNGAEGGLRSHIRFHGDCFQGSFALHTAHLGMWLASSGTIREPSVYETDAADLLS